LALCASCNGFVAAFGDTFIADDDFETPPVAVVPDAGFNGGSSFGGNGARAGNGGGGFGGTQTCAQPLTSFNVGCDAVGTLRQFCAQGGCHNATSAGGRLDLTPDDLFVARTLNVPARMAVASSGVACIPATCPPLGSTLLIDSNAPETSFMLHKMEGFDPASSGELDIGCGTAMPMQATPATSSYMASHSACLESLFLAVAMSGRPCARTGQEPAPPLPACP
jgi:hypothetical protein